MEKWNDESMKRNKIKEYEELDQLHFKVENGLISLIRSLQKKRNHGDWQEIFIE